MNKTAFTSVVLFLALSSCPLVVQAAPPLGTSPTITTVDCSRVVDSAKNKYGLPATTPITIETLAPAANLDDLLKLERSSYAGAVVTSTFYDYRTVSIYRSNPGLHLGYDIAMPAGAAVLVGWPGKVVDIVPWTDTQWGITVLSPSGFEVTYGHLEPSVSVGQQLNVGDTVGRVALDHVDVKMRDAAGVYVPFGQDYEASAAHAYTKVIPVSSKEQLMVAWLEAHHAVTNAKLELEKKIQTQQVYVIKRKFQESQFSIAKNNNLSAQQWLEEGMISRLQKEEYVGIYNSRKTELAALKKEQAALPTQISKLKRVISNGNNVLAAAKKKATARGITWQNVVSFANNMVANDADLRRNVKKDKTEKLEAWNAEITHLQNEISKLRDSVAEYQELYDMGCISRDTLTLKQRQLKLKEGILAVKIGSKAKPGQLKAKPTSKPTAGQQKAVPTNKKSSQKR